MSPWLPLDHTCMKTHTLNGHCCSLPRVQSSSFHFRVIVSNWQRGRSGSLLVMWRKWVNSLSNYTSPTDTNLHTNTIAHQSTPLLYLDCTLQGMMFWLLYFIQTPFRSSDSQSVHWLIVTRCISSETMSKFCLLFQHRAFVCSMRTSNGKHKRSFHSFDTEIAHCCVSL